MSVENVSDWLYSFSSEAKKFQLVKDRYKTTKATTISIASGKGGVGKTSISVKLAKSLAAQGHRVLLLDCDFNLSNTSIKLNIPLNENFMDLITSRKSFDECVIKQGMLDILPSTNGNLELFNDKLQMYEIMVSIIYEHQDKYDYILLDSAAGLSKDSINLNAYCDHRLLIVTPDKSSITDSYSLMKVLSKSYGITENHLLINMLNNQRQYLNVIQTISETAETFLSCRTNVIGGLKKYDYPTDSFDKLFLGMEDSAANKDFAKLTCKLTEKMGRRFDYGVQSRRNVNIRDAQVDIQ